jgi:hypothetical protein
MGSPTRVEGQITSSVVDKSGLNVDPEGSICQKGAPRVEI